MMIEQEKALAPHSFYDLLPVYDVSPKDIEQYLKQKLLESKI